MLQHAPFLSASGKQRTVTHEIAHCLGVDHGTQVMDPLDGPQDPDFSPESLDELRNYEGPEGP